MQHESLIPSDILRVMDKGCSAWNGDESLIEIGTGHYSRVYGNGLDRVLKFTCDAAHAEYAFYCMKEHSSNALLPVVYSVEEIGECELTNDSFGAIWVIEQERLGDVPERTTAKHKAYRDLLQWTLLYSNTVEESLAKLALLGAVKDAPCKQDQSLKLASTEPLWVSLDENPEQSLRSMRRMSRLSKRVFKEVTDLLGLLQDVFFSLDTEANDSEVLLDLHGGNIMYRESQVVAVDPVCSVI